MKKKEKKPTIHLVGERFPGAEFDKRRVTCKACKKRF